MSPELFHGLVIRPTLRWLATFDPGVDSLEAELQLLATAIQESNLKARKQMPRGPARSLFQIESPTAYSVLNKWKPARDFCEALLLSTGNLTDFSYMLKFSDAGACAIARGILRLDPRPLPKIGDQGGAWECYMRCWRPGKPRPEKWAATYKLAMESVD